MLHTATTDLVKIFSQSHYKLSLQAYNLPHHSHDVNVKVIQCFVYVGQWVPIIELIKLPNINYVNAYDFSNMYSFSKDLPFYCLDWNEPVESQFDLDVVVPH